MTNVATDKSLRSVAAITLFLCFCTAVIEGIDLQSMGLAAPKLAPEFHFIASQMKWVMLASPAGLFIGALVGGRLADKWGRKVALLGSIAIFGVFQLATAWAQAIDFGGASLSAYWVLIIVRVLCGLGLGGALPNLIALVAEASGGKNNILNVVITAAGMPTGGALASYIAFTGGEHGDWRTVFYIGGLAPLVLAPIMALALPESKLFQLAKAAAGEVGIKVNSLVVLFGGGRAIASILLWIGLFFTTLVLYLLLNWLPTLMISKGFTKTEANFIQIFFNVGSAVGSIVLGWLMQRKPSRMILFVCYVGVAVSLMGLMYVGKDLALAITGEAVVGTFLLGAQYILYGLTPTFYRTAVRGTGTGAAVAAGRFGSAVGPYLGGALLGAGQGAAQVLQSLLPVTAAAAVAAILLMFCKRAED